MGPVPKWESLLTFSMYILAVPILILFLLLVTVLLVIWGHWKIALVVLILTIWLNKTTQTYPVDLFYEEEWQAEPRIPSPSVSSPTMWLASILTP